MSQVISTEATEPIGDPVVDDGPLLGGGLFDDESPVSEEELMSEDEEEVGDDHDSEESSEHGEVSDSEDSKDGEESSGEEETESQPKDDKKPPAGFVPHQALKEERIKRQELASEVERLRAEIESVKSLRSEPREEKTKADEFKVLSDEEFDELVEESPQDAVRYQRALSKYEKELSRQEAEKFSRAETEKRNALSVERAVERVREKIPALYEEGSDHGEKLRDFAIKNGLSPEAIDRLANPRTMIITPGSNTPVPLGEDAASFVEMINSVFNGSNPEKLKADLEATIRKEVTDSVTKELMAKLNKNPAAFRDIGDSPGSSDKPTRNKEYTEDEFMRLSKKEQDAYLMEP
jgi:hypothetical protein